MAIKGLFPSLDRDFLKNLLGSQIRLGWSVVTTTRPLALQDVFSNLEQPSSKRCADLGYPQRRSYQPCNPVNPYRLINTKGIWYLAAVHDGRLEHSALKVARFSPHDDFPSVMPPSVDEHVQTEEGIWHSSPASTGIAVLPRRQLTTSNADN